MCLIAFAIGAHPRWPLVIAANRDEHYERPTTALELWTSPSGQLIASGRDERAGGTWLGISASGRVAMLTNVREPSTQARARSRGELPMAWLETDQAAEPFLAAMDWQAYSGFNLVIGDLIADQWQWISNRQPAASGPLPGLQQRALSPGIYGLSNAFLDTPWPKTVQLTHALTHSLASLQEPQLLRERLWQALADRRRPADEELPRTGVPWPLEQELASAWVQLSSGHYGTRSSLLTLAERTADGHWLLELQEKSWQGQAGLRHTRLQVPASVRR
jgi:uncharacterized protein with NRDE domain